MSAIKLFYTDMYLKTCESTVVSVEPKGLLLDKTIFFPEGGGQIYDTGIINNARVIGAYKLLTKNTRTIYSPDFPSVSVNTDVLHVIDDDLNIFSVGQKVTLSLDWHRRYNIMRMHSASHVVFHFINVLQKDITVLGCLINESTARFDFDKIFSPRISNSIIIELEALSNAFINNNYAIKNVPFQNETEALYWLCDNIKIPCGGTHVRSTGEIGSIQIKRKSQGKKVDRLYIRFKDNYDNNKSD